MFSMRYTSPKATKKEVSSGSLSASSSAPALGPSSLSSIDVSAFKNDLRNSSTTNHVAGSCNGKANSMPEADSALANISENIYPRPINSLALLNRGHECYDSSCGEGSDNDTPQRSAAKQVHDIDYMHSGIENAADRVQNMHSIEASSTGSEGHTLDEAQRERVDYQRSTSMEPMVGVLSGQSQQFTRSPPAGRTSHPRPINLLALLDRGHECYDSSEEGSDKGLLQRSAAKQVDDVDYMHSGMKTAADGIQNMDLIKASSKNIEEHTADERTKAYVDYQRSASMEPMVGVLAGQSHSFTHSPPSGRKSPVVGQINLISDTQITSSTSERSCSPIAYDGSAQSTPPMILGVKRGRFVAEPNPVDSPFSGATDSEIGSDRYFDLPNPHDEEKKLRSDSIGDDLVHVTLPPRVNRTTLPKFPCNPARAFSAQPVLSPRPIFPHTHSLLDDCSDEEDETTTFTIVDSPTRHATPYSCLAGPQASSMGTPTFSSYFEEQNRTRHSAGNSAGSNATQKASNNIQQALLQTRHRRWDCQSIFAGSHAQSKEVFDVSNRSYYISGYPPGAGCGLSVSVEAIRVAALASGLWRTVKRVRLPKGLFGARGAEDCEIRALLTCIASTFPMLNSIDFCGDIFRVSNTSYEFSGRDRRDEIISCIMECLPNIVAIDGFVVEERVVGTEVHTDEKSISGSEDATNSNADRSTYNMEQVTLGPVKNSASSIVYESVSISRLEGEAQNSLMATSAGSMQGVDHSDITPNSMFTKPNWEETTTVLKSKQIEVAVNFASHRSRNKALPADKRPSTHLGNNSQRRKIDSPANGLIDDEVKKSSSASPTYSMLSSSLSWGSNVGETRPQTCGPRPPACPTSASQLRPRLPAKPKNKKTKGSMMKAGVGFRRQVIGLIPTVSMMDADVDNDSDDSEQAVDSDCPTDLL
ncbi:hypothetical protein ACHAW5_005084 [Stephanodiscus triporus]|uniref:Uncharacterized protein n=1 Tax=Stephanodiscus triporus TaxID=2934178 RepID=A0ABD3MHZ0_9STRA